MIPYTPDIDTSIQIQYLYPCCIRRHLHTIIPLSIILSSCWRHQTPLAIFICAMYFYCATANYYKNIIITCQVLSSERRRRRADVSIILILIIFYNIIIIVFGDHIIVKYNCRQVISYLYISNMYMNHNYLSIITGQVSRLQVVNT